MLPQSAEELNISQSIGFNSGQKRQLLKISMTVQCITVLCEVLISILWYVRKLTDHSQFVVCYERFILNTNCHNREL